MLVLTQCMSERMLQMLGVLQILCMWGQRWSNWHVHIVSHWDCHWDNIARDRDYVPRYWHFPHNWY